MPQLGSQILTGIILVECFLKMFSPREKARADDAPRAIFTTGISQEIIHANTGFLEVKTRGCTQK